MTDGDHSTEAQGEQIRTVEAVSDSKEVVFD